MRMNTLLTMTLFWGDSKVVVSEWFQPNVTLLLFLQVQTDDTMLGHTHLLSGNTTTAMCDAECQTDSMTPPQASLAPSVENVPCSSEPGVPCAMVSAECQTDTMTPPRASPAPNAENVPCSSEPGVPCAMVSAECQTEAAAEPESNIAVGAEDTWSERGRQYASIFVSTECQTVTGPSELSLDVCVGGTRSDSPCSQEVSLAPCVGPSQHGGGALESSICIHRDETKKAVEKMENVSELYVYVWTHCGNYRCTRVYMLTQQSSLV